MLAENLFKITNQRLNNQVDNKGTGFSRQTTIRKLNKDFSQLTSKDLKDLAVDFEWEEKGELGRGSFGSVVLGVKNDTGELLAVKKMSVTTKTIAVEDAEKEIILLSGLENNQHVVKLIGYQQSEGFMYIFMEYVEGGSIESLFKKMSKLNEKLAAKYTQQILKGLKHLHQNGVIHGDIKCNSLSHRRRKHSDRQEGNLQAR